MPVLGSSSSSALKAQGNLFFPEDYGAKGDGISDDTAAIQAAIDAACASGNGVVQFGPRVYLCNGAPRTDRGGNAILTLPQYPLTGGTLAPTVTLRGVGSAMHSQEVALSTSTPAATIFTTTRTDTYNGVSGSGGIGIPCLLGGPSYEVHSSGAYTLLQVVIEDLAVLLPNNPKLAGIDLASCVRAHVDRTSVTTVNRTTVVPTTKTAFGLRMPETVNYGVSKIGSYLAAGVFAGVIANTEHFNADYICGKWCVVNVALTGNGGAHASRIGMIQSEWCKYHLTSWSDVNGQSDFLGRVCLVVELLDIEDMAVGGAFATVAHVSDSSNFLHGAIRYSRFQGGVAGFQNGVTVNGATHVTFTDLNA